MDVSRMMEIIGISLAISGPFILLILGIMFVSSHKRMAQAQEETAKAQTELVKQLANIAIELRHLSNSGRN